MARWTIGIEIVELPLIPNADSINEIFFKRELLCIIQEREAFSDFVE